MANLTESQVFTAGVYQLETADQVLGGAGGIANSQAQALANRTAYLKQITDSLTGIVLPYAGSAAPTGWLMCYGQAVSRTTYAALFAVIGTTFGVGDGSTTFNVPDCRGRVIAGKDNMGGSAASRLTNSGTGHPGIDGATLGATGGADRHQLTVAQMPAHTHTEEYSSTTFAVQGGSSGTVLRTQSTQATGNAGGDQAHPNAQPTIVMNSIIKT